MQNKNVLQKIYGWVGFFVFWAVVVLFVWSLVGGFASFVNKMNCEADEIASRSCLYRCK